MNSPSDVIDGIGRVDVPDDDSVLLVDILQELCGRCCHRSRGGEVWLTA